jgi:hypothetical protein
LKFAEEKAKASEQNARLEERETEDISKETLTILDGDEADNLSQVSGGLSEEP